MEERKKKAAVDPNLGPTEESLGPAETRDCIPSPGGAAGGAHHDEPVA